MGDDEIWLGGLFIEWCTFDFVTRTGRTIATMFLDEHRADVSPRARLFVERCAASPFRLTQVEAVDRGRGLTLLDLLDRGRRYHVRDRLGSEEMVLHDVVIARLVPDHEDWLIEGTPSRLQVHDKEPLLLELKRLRKRLSVEAPDASAAEQRMALSRNMLTYVVDRVMFPELPQLQTADGEPLDPASVVFAVVDPAGVTAALAADPAATGARAQAHFVSILGDKARFIRVDDIWDETLASDDDAGDADERDPALESEFFEAHYRKWLDEPVPALRGRTPREACAIKHLRRRLLTLVEGIENQAAMLLCFYAHHRRPPARSPARRENVCRRARREP